MVDIASLSPFGESRRRKARNSLVEFCVQQPLGLLSLLVIISMILAGIFADYIAPYDPLETSLVEALKPPSWTHLLGTDPFGRDILSRLI
jgi:peptide/nickel transport system permease protein